MGAESAVAGGPRSMALAEAVLRASSCPVAGVVVGGRFVVERRAGSGGMATIFRAHDQLDGAPVALKIMRGDDADDVERFAREAGILAELQHPGIVRYIAHGTTLEGAHYVAMEWLDGEDLSELLARRNRLPIGEALTLARRAAEALGFAHARGMVHRDIKPSNIFLPGGDVERVKLIDFGLARVARDDQKLTRTGWILGTPAYMAPEQIQLIGDPDPRSDVFSLGCVLFECLAGRPAFEGANPLARLAKILLEEAPSLCAILPGTPPALDRLIARTLAKKPTERPSDGAAFAVELAALGGTAPARESWPEISARRTLASQPPLSEPQPSSRSLTLSEQRLVTVVLAGDADAAAEPRTTLHSVIAELQAIVEPHGGHLDALAGGPLIVTMWGPGNAADRAERAAHCALALRARLPGLPVCLTTGRGRVAARVVEGGVIDQAVLALRTTPSGLVQLDSVSADMLGARFEIDRQGEALFLRGERAWEEGAPRLLGSATPHVGCGREMSMLEGMLCGCAEESVATAVIVSGPAGSGKSRLWQELRDKIRQRGDNVEILWGRGDSLGAGSPFWIIGDAIRRAAGVRDTDPLASRQEKIAARIGRHLEGAHRARVIAFLGEMAGTPFPDKDDAMRAAAGNAILMGDSMRAAWEDWLAAECGARPVLLALEDLHRGDSASLGLIDSTLRNLHDRPLMVLALARPEIHAHFPGFWGERAVQTIQLGPLARRACERLVTGALGEGASADVVARIVERAAGNPFYLEELIRAVAAGRGEAFPDSVLATVEARLDAEGSEAKRILRAASVFGERFSRDGVAALLGGDAHRAEAGAWLRTLATRELVVPTGSPGVADDTDYVFRHALVRDATNAMLTEADRVLGHRLAAEWLEHSGHPENMAIAEHFRRGELPAQATVWYRRAAERALEANDLTAALERAELGVACGAAGQELGGLRLVQAEAHVWRGELAEGEVHGGSAIGLVQWGTVAWFRAVTQTITAAGKLGGFERVEGWGELAAAVPVEGASSAQIAAQIASLSWIATHLIFGGRYVTAAALLSTLDRIAERPAAIEPQAIALLYQVRAIRASVTGDLGAGLDGFKAALAAFEQTGDERNASAVRSNLGFIFAELGDYAGAEEALRAALAAADRMGLHDLAIAALHNLGRVLAYRGRIADARTLEQRALDAYTRQGDPRMAGSARAYLAQIAVLAGDHDAAEREARVAVEVLIVAPPLRAGALSILARALLAKGRLADAFAAAKEAYVQLESLGSLEEGEAAVRLVYAETLAARGARQEFAMAIVEARARLLSRAAKISDPMWRERFLTGVPENARTLELSDIGALLPAPESGRR